MKKYPMRTLIARSPINCGMVVLCTLLLVALQLPGQAINYGNDWYQPGTDYLRFKTASDGIYRVTAAQLLQAGFDTTGVDPSHLHLYCRGEEQYLHIEPGTAAGWEYLEFFGRRNDGGLDTLLYGNPLNRHADGGLHPNPRYSMYSDTMVYYFYADNQPGLRLQSPFLGTVPPPLIVEEVVRTSIVDYPPGSPDGEFRTRTASQYDVFSSLNPQWSWGEGYVGKAPDFNDEILVTLPTPHALTTTPATLRLRYQSMTVQDQVFSIYLDGHLLGVDSTRGFFVKDTSFVYPYPLGQSAELKMVVTVPSQTGSYFSTLNLAALAFPSETDLNGDASIVFSASNPTMAYYRFHHIAAGNLAVAYDLVNHVRHTDTIRQDSLGMWLAGQAQSSVMHLQSDATISSPEISSAPLSNLSSTTQAANLVVITSRELAASAEAYRNYRQNSVANPLSVKVVYVDEIYQEFGDGMVHPYAIRRFCNYAMDHWAVKPGYFLIWGKGRVESRTSSVNHVPLFGDPASDHLYLCSLRRDTLLYHPRAAIGRLSVFNDQQGYDYLSKLATYETAASQPWMRNGVFVCHARDSVIFRPISEFVDSFTVPFRGPQAVGRALEYKIYDSTLVNPPVVTQTDVLNQGASLLWMFGVSPNLMGMNELANLANEGKYPIHIGMACIFNSMNLDTLTQAERWVLEPNRGAIASIGHSCAPFLIPSGLWGEFLMHHAFEDNPGAMVGDLIRSASDTMLARWGDQVYLNHALCMNLIGDPSLHFRTGTFEVWPGDANDDLTADVQDLLSIGIAFGDTGAGRPLPSIGWIGQPAPLWDSAFTNGTNVAHADCNGDGLVDADDTLAIVQNYGLIHNKAVGLLLGSTDDPELAIESALDTIPGGTRLELTVSLGSDEHPADSVYGLYGVLPLNPELLDSTTFTIDFDSCWLGTVGIDLLTLARYNHALGQVEFAITRTDHEPVSGQGEVARIGIVVIDNISGKFPGDTTLLPLTLLPSAGRMVNAEGEDLALQGLGKRVFLMGEQPAAPLPLGQSVAVFPNPTTGEIYVQTTNMEAATLAVYDALGRQVRDLHFAAGAHKRVDLTGLRPGVYLLKLKVGADEFPLRVTKVD